MPNSIYISNIKFGRKLILRFSVAHFLLFQDGRIDYNEFVAMMQDTGFGQKGLQSSVGIEFRDAFKLDNT